jgi:hypothetical protein
MDAIGAGDTEERLKNGYLRWVHIRPDGSLVGMMYRLPGPGEDICVLGQWGTDRGQSWGTSCLAPRARIKESSEAI